jgi:hypothetical protein
MYITINNEFSGAISEETLLGENEEIIGIFSEICGVIDDLKIAKFSVLFKEWDPRFNYSDFAYDFTSVADELPGLIQFLDNKSDEYSLGFYELDRRIIFTFLNKMLFFSIYHHTKGDAVLFHGELDAIKFKLIIEKLINDFSILLSRFFPNAYEIFLREKYIIS